MQAQHDPSSAKAELQHLLTTPISVPGQQHSSATLAHAALERLRDAGDERYLFLRTLLECLQLRQQQQQQQQQHHYNSDDELLMFHCITGLRHVVLHGWRRFSSVFTQGLRDWMMLLGHSFGASGNSSGNHSQSRTLRVACYTTSVALWKRSWLELTANGVSLEQQQQLPPDAQQQSLLGAMQQAPLQVAIPSNSLPFLSSPLALFQYLEQSILPASLSSVVAAPSSPANLQASQEAALALTVPCTLYLQAFVEEFAGTKSAVTYQLPLEFHRQTRQSFERSNNNTGGLYSCLHLAMKALSVVLPRIQQQQQQQQQSPSEQQPFLAIAQGMIQIVCDCVGWEFGMDAFVVTPHSAMSQHATGLVRPPKDWSQHHLTAPALVTALWQTHAQQRLVKANTNINTNSNELPHTLRQLLLLLASLEGPIFASPQERKEFLAAVLQGTLELLQVQVAALTAVSQQQQQQQQWNDAQWTELLDTLEILSRLVTNGKWPLLIQFHKDPLLPALLQGLTAIARILWEQHVQEAATLRGELGLMEYGDVREEVLNQLLEAVVAVTGDPWLWYSGNTAERTWARQQVGQSLAGPLYGIWTQGRMQLAAWEEHYLCTHSNDDVEEDYEHISAVQLEEEMQSLSTVGRINVKGAMQSISTLFQQTIPKLQTEWSSPLKSADVSPELAGLLEQARLLTLYIGHLLTDDNSGETPVIPESIGIACREAEDDTISTIFSAMEALFSLAQMQALKLAEQPHDPRLSPLLANSFLWCLNRWAPAYIFSVDYNTSTINNSPAANAKNIGAVWSSPEKAQQAVSFAITLCLHFQCYWPQEHLLQENAATLLLSLAKRAAGADDQHNPMKLRSLMVASPSFTQMMVFHCLTAGTRHSISRAELEQTIQVKAAEANTSVDMAMIAGYQRLPYDIKSKILASLLVASSEQQTERLWKDCLKAVQDAFSTLLQALSRKQVSADDINAKEMTCLCVEMFRGVAGASEMSEPSRIPTFITPNLANLSGLMHYYAEDLTICERLLRFFRDYTEQFVIMLNREQCLALFQASAELLKSYSSHHCNSKTRVIDAKSTEEANLDEEQKYGDILCAIQLLIHLGTKDFIDICSSTSAQGVDSAQVTDVIFFGLQQILPLMTQGLLQMPTLCSQYFSLVGFMMDTYPEKIAVLPYELFDALMESLLFGMCHHDPTVAKSSLQGIASITREHLKSRILTTHLTRNPGFLDKCSSRLLLDVVFQNKVWDRLESAGMALLPLAAVDVNRFANVVTELVNKIPVDDQKARLQASFQSLMQPEVLHKVASGGLEGRKNRIQFKKDFDNFCHNVHSFLILK